MPLRIYRRKFINVRILLHIIGWLLLIEAGFMIIPLVASLCYGDSSSLEFAVSIAVTAATGGALVLFLKPESREMGKREAILFTGFTWVVLSMFGMLPFLICRTHLNVTDAFFETMSGFTTTGASVLNSLEGVPKSILLWRCVVQWIGGLGIILFTLAVVPMLNYNGGMQLFYAEVTGVTHDKLRPRISFTAQGLWLVYASLTVLLIILLNFSEMDFFDALCYGLSTMSTGGFANSDMALSAYSDMYIKIVMVIFMFLGGVNFTIIFKAANGNLRPALKNDALKWYVRIILICYVLLCLNVWRQGLVKDIEDVTIDPLFQAVSILSSTGITEPDFADWGPLATVVVIFMMFMGACAGSTSGGAKIDRFIILVKFIRNEFYKVMHQSAVTSVNINGKGVPQSLVMKTLSFMFLYVMLVIAGGVALVMLGMPLSDSLFCSLSAISNTGLGTDTTGIGGNFYLVAPAAKWILSFIMLAGRLELYTVLLVFTPYFWRK